MIQSFPSQVLLKVHQVRQVGRLKGVNIILYSASLLGHKISELNDDKVCQVTRDKYHFLITFRKIFSLLS